MRVDQRGALDGHQGIELVGAGAATQVSLPLGAANDEQQLEVDALAAGHRAPSAALPTGAQPELMYRRWGRGFPWGRRTASDSGGRGESPPASTPRLAVPVALRAACPLGRGSDDDSHKSPPLGNEADAGCQPDGGGG